MTSQNVKECYTKQRQQFQLISDIRLIIFSFFSFSLLTREQRIFFQQFSILSSFSYKKYWKPYLSIAKKNMICRLKK